MFKTWELVYRWALEAKCQAFKVFVLEWDCLHPYGTTTALMFGNYNNQCIQVIRTGT